MQPPQAQDWRCKVTPAEIAEVKVRFQSGTHTDSDVRALISHAEHTPSIGQTIALLKDSEDYWERVVMATNPVTGSVPVRFKVGGPSWAEIEEREYRL